MIHSHARSSQRFSEVLLRKSVTDFFSTQNVELGPCWGEKGSNRALKSNDEKTR